MYVLLYDILANYIHRYINYLYFYFHKVVVLVAICKNYFILCNKSINIKNIIINNTHIGTYQIWNYFSYNFVK